MPAYILHGLIVRASLKGVTADQLDSHTRPGFDTPHAALQGG